MWQFRKKAPQRKPPVPVVPLPRLKSQDLAELIKPMELSDDAQALAERARSPGEYLAMLLTAELFDDAIGFLAKGMQPDDAISWACKCGERVRGQLSPEEKAALDAAKAWCGQPGAKAAAAAREAANQAGHQGPGAWAAEAAAWVTRNADPAAQEQLDVGHAVAGSVKLAVVEVGKITGINDQNRADVYEPFIRFGREIAGAKDR